MQTAKRVVKNTGYLYARMGITVFISLWTTRIILNALGANDFGIYNVVGGAIGMLAFLNSSMAAATQRYMSFYRGSGENEKCKEIFNASVVLHFLISLLLVICLILTGWLFFNFVLNIPEERIKAAYFVYLCVLISTFFSVISVPYEATINAHENMRYYAIVGLFESLLKLIVAFVVVYVITDKLVVYSILMACIPLITLTIMRIYCRSHYEECKLSLSKYLKKDIMKDMTSFAGWSFLTSISSVFTQHGLGILLNHFYGALLNAAQGIANQLSGMLMSFCNSMLKALSPVITKQTGAGQQSQAALATLLGNKYSYVLLAIFAIPCMLEMPSVLRLWVKNVPEWGVLFCQLQLLRSVVEQLFNTLRTAISAQGRIKNFSIINSILNILPFVLTYFLFSKGCPPYMMYVSWIGFYSIGGGIVMVYFSKQLCNISYEMFSQKVFLPCLVITIAMLIAGYLSMVYVEPSLFRIAITFTLTSAGLIFSLLLLMSNEEKQIFKELLSKKRCFVR